MSDWDCPSACDHSPTAAKRAWCHDCSEWCYSSDRCARGREVQVIDLLREAVGIDGDHHKQWYLEQLADVVGIELPDHEPGIAP